MLFEAHDSWDVNVHTDDGSDLCWEFYESHGHVSFLPACIPAHTKGHSGPCSQDIFTSDQHCVIFIYLYLSNTSNFT